MVSTTWIHHIILLVNDYTKQQRTHLITPNSTSQAAQLLPQPHSNQEASSWCQQPITSYYMSMNIPNSKEHI